MVFHICHACAQKRGERANKIRRKRARWLRLVRKYRSNIEIVQDILRAASEGAKKTHIMQRANLNPVMFHKYFPTLLANRLIVGTDARDGDPFFKVSNDGREFLRMAVSLSSRLDRKAREEPAYLLR